MPATTEPPSARKPPNLPASMSVTMSFDISRGRLSLAAFDALLNTSLEMISPFTGGMNNSGPRSPTMIGVRALTDPPSAKKPPNRLSPVLMSDIMPPPPPNPPPPNSPETKPPMPLNAPESPEVSEENSPPRLLKKPPPAPDAENRLPSIPMKPLLPALCSLNVSASAAP